MNLFTFFGGFDFKRINKKVETIVKIKSLNLSKNKKNFYQNLNNADVIICSGGLTVFDAIYFNKIIIAIPQYNHQLINLNYLSKEKVCFLIKIDKNFEKKFHNKIKEILSLSLKEKQLIYNKQNKIIYYQSQINILNKIYDFSKSVF